MRPKLSNTMKERRLSASLSLENLIMDFENPFTPIQKNYNNAILRQSHAKQLLVGVTSFEIYRNRVPKKVKLLDVKLSFSYQDNYQTETDLLEKELVRKGKKWNWPLQKGQNHIITFPYAPGDRVNLNFGMTVFKTKKMSVFSSETLTSPVGNVTDCFVLAKNNGVGIGLPIDTVITNHVRLNFSLDGYAHHMTIKLKLGLIEESSGNPSLWLRPISIDKPFRSSQTLLEMLGDPTTFPPMSKGSAEELVKHRSFIASSQKMVNYLRSGVLDCWSVRPCSGASELPSGIQIRMATSNKPIACILPVVERLETLPDTAPHLRLGLLVICGSKPYCLCSAKWRSSDKFDFKIHYYESGETWGQRIKWNSRDFLDINHIILNSTGHQYFFKPGHDTALQDICIGLCGKFLVRFSNEILPWKKEMSTPLSEIDLDLDHTDEGYSDESLALKPCNPIDSCLRTIPEFLRSHGLTLYCDIAARLDEIQKLDHERMVEKPTLRRINSASSYGDTFQGYIKNDNRGSRKSLKKYNNKDQRGSEGDITTSGFVEDFTGYSFSRTASYSNIESMID
ncbi:uncharacterized protein LOC127735351 [Mytilus californianus]|uniref:uncharacterized protein LOC127735351 n=1 Tax=Mytilus californianus TaxID=6549 RepID=UPI002245449A|nr:uncharacterized protein LOC127735351 [Mytilus californianus]XP_052101474.1 uncharacterized protein LOC127735351 [Mytilus californianus]